MKSKLLIMLCCLPAILMADISAANRMAESGRYDEALKELNQAISQDPSARTYKLRGHVYIAKGDLSKALSDLSQAISLAPNSAKPYVDRAIVHYKMGNKGLALDDMAKAEKIAPESAWVQGVKEKISND